MDPGKAQEAADIGLHIPEATEPAHMVTASDQAEAPPQLIHSRGKLTGYQNPTEGVTIGI